MMHSVGPFPCLTPFSSPLLRTPPPALHRAPRRRPLAQTAARQRIAHQAAGAPPHHPRQRGQVRQAALLVLLVEAPPAGAGGAACWWWRRRLLVEAPPAGGGAAWWRGRGAGRGHVAREPVQRVGALYQACKVVKLSARALPGGRAVNTLSPIHSLSPRQPAPSVISCLASPFLDRHYCSAFPDGWARPGSITHRSVSF